MPWHLSLYGTNRPGATISGFMSPPSESRRCREPYVGAFPDGASTDFRLVCTYFQFGLPSCTWPFCLATLLFLLITTGNRNIYRMPLSKVTYTEENRIFYQQAKKRLAESPLWEQPKSSKPTTAKVTRHFWVPAPVDYWVSGKLIFTTSNFHTNLLVISYAYFFSFKTPRPSSDMGAAYPMSMLWPENFNHYWGLGTRTVTFLWSNDAPMKRREAGASYWFFS